MKLSKTQQALLEKMQAGGVLHFMPYTRSNPCAYFHCGPGSGRCTAAANALIEKGLVEKVGERWKVDYSLTDAGKAWKPDETERPKNEKQISN